MPKRESDKIITFTTSAETKEALEACAHDQDRSLSWVVRKTLESMLEKEGYLTRSRKKASKKLDAE